MSKSTNDIEKVRLKRILEFMRETEMAVVISMEGSEEEVDKFNRQGLDIKPHRVRLNTVDKHGSDIEARFKDDKDPLRLVFVCAMWLTGFDVKSLSTLYLDKPMKNHTLMQAIARANRVSSHQINDISKTNGEIIDYYNIFRNMQQALADYAQGDDSSSPIQEKSHLFVLLDEAIESGLTFCRARAIDLESLLDSDETFKSITQFGQFADTLLSKDEWYKTFKVYQNTIDSLYEACKPEILKQESRPLVFIFQYLRAIIEGKIDVKDLEGVGLQIEQLLDQSLIVTDRDSKQEYGTLHTTIREGKIWDLSKIDFDKLRQEFKTVTYKNIEIHDLRSFLESKIDQMISVNITRTDFSTRLQAIIDRYNAGGSATEDYYESLLKFTEALNTEAERHIREGLTEDELELFDLLKQEKMTAPETQKVKLAAKSLLNRLIASHPKVLVQDWYKDAQTQSKVKSAVESVLDENLPDSYDRILFKQKCDRVFDLICLQASQGFKWTA